MEARAKALKEAGDFDAAQKIDDQIVAIDDSMRDGTYDYLEVTQRLNSKGGLGTSKVQQFDIRKEKP